MINGPSLAEPLLGRADQGGDRTRRPPERACHAGGHRPRIPVGGRRPPARLASALRVGGDEHDRRSHQHPRELEHARALGYRPVADGPPRRRGAAGDRQVHAAIGRRRPALVCDRLSRVRRLPRTPRCHWRPTRISSSAPAGCSSKIRWRHGASSGEARAADRKARTGVDDPLGGGGHRPHARRGGPHLDRVAGAAQLPRRRGIHRPGGGRDQWRDPVLVPRHHRRPRGRRGAARLRERPGRP